MSLRDWATVAALVISSIGMVLQLILHADRWVHQQDTSGTRLAERLTALEKLVPERFAEIKALIAEANAKASSRNSTHQDKLGTLQILVVRLEEREKMRLVRSVQVAHQGVEDLYKGDA